jgi:hypothetical protein
LEAIEAQIKEDDLINRKKKQETDLEMERKEGWYTTRIRAQRSMPNPGWMHRQQTILSRQRASPPRDVPLRHRETAITGPLVLQECYLTGPSFVVVGWAIGDHQIRVQTI